MRTRLASPDDISSTARSAKCDIPKSANAASAISRCLGLKAWFGKMRVLLKKPERTTSKPLASPVHEDIKIVRHDAEQESQLKTFQFVRPRMAMLEPFRTTG